MKQVFISTSLSKNTESKKIYWYEFLGKQTRSSKDALGLVVC